ncbi:MAG: response regulator [Ignavibacteriae bacterium]|nr:MAG: response regulator [Ignavibacteriota bacterium]
MAKILIIDDSLFIRNVLSKMIKELNHTPFSAKDGDEGLAMIENEKYDIIFLDLLMPGKTGFDVLEILRKRNNRIPVIIISADIQKSSREKSFELGAKFFINKPPVKEELKQKVSEILS